MSKDSYSQALQNRRGGSIDPSLVQLAYGSHQSAEDQIPEAVDQVEGGTPGPKVAQTLGEAIGYPGFKKKTPKAVEGDQDLAEVANVKQGQKPVNSDEPMPHVDSDGDFDEDASSAKAEIRDHIIGHESPDEYDRVKDMKPQSLGERAKIAAMKEKYEKA